MSPENQSVFLAPEKGEFSMSYRILQFMKMVFFEVLSWLVGLVLENWVDGIDMHLQTVKT